VNQHIIVIKRTDIKADIKIDIEMDMSNIRTEVKTEVNRDQDRKSKDTKTDSKEQADSTTLNSFYITNSPVEPDRQQLDTNIHIQAIA
jgi:beta-lactamase class A